jgi:serine/threonine protein kinase
MDDLAIITERNRTFVHHTQTIVNTHIPYIGLLKDKHELFRRTITGHEIGRGGNGVVYQLIDAQNKVALPLVLKRVISSNSKIIDHYIGMHSRVMDVIGESDCNTLLDIIALRSMRKDDGLFVADTIMHRMDGDLHDILYHISASGFYSDAVQSLAHATRDLAEGLSQLHRSGLCHMDVKDLNIMLRRNDSGNGQFDFDAQLGDFDALSFINNPHDSCVGQCGTPEFMPPELVTNPQPVSYSDRCDWWSVGMVIVRSMLSIQMSSDFIDKLQHKYPCCRKDGDRLLIGNIHNQQFLDIIVSDITGHIIMSDQVMAEKNLLHHPPDEHRLVVGVMCDLITLLLVVDPSQRAGYNVVSQKLASINK